MIRALAALAVVGAMTGVPAAAGDCSVSESSIAWGFKESFRSYISGAIANGEWSVADGATYETPLFGFADAAGSYDNGSGDLAFAGSIEFTGHDGILDTTVANPVIRFDGSQSAMLLLDVSGTTQQGDAVDATAVPFATIDLAASTTSTVGGVISIADAPVTLTDAGAEAFGTYPAGEALDPMTIEFAVAEDCAALPAGFPWLVASIGGVVALAGLIGVAVIALRKRRAANQQA